MTRQEACRLIERIGLVPVVRAFSQEDARFAAEAICQGGIPVVEITMTVRGALTLISDLIRALPEVLIGAGTVLDAEMARRCGGAGARFLVTPGFDPATVDFARKMDLIVMAGALTPTEVLSAWKAGSDFVKVFPCANVGGPAYIKALRGPLPQIPLVPTGGVTLKTAQDYIRAGAAALGVGGELVRKEAIASRNAELILKMASEFREAVRVARGNAAPARESTPQPA